VSRKPGLPGRALPWSSNVAAGWLLAIAANLLLSGHFLDVAARDVALAVAASALARLAPLHERTAAHSPVRAEPALTRP
jgi:hypothetical protein